MEQMQYNLLFRWFVGLGIDDPVWVPTVFTKNRDRLLTTDIARKFLAAILAHREVAPLLSDEHFSVDGTLIKAWASMKSFQPKAEAAPPDAAGGPDDPPCRRRQPRTPPRPAPRRPSPIRCPSRPATNRNAEVDFHGEKAVERHPCLDDRSRGAAVQEAPGDGPILCFMGHTLMENRNGLIVQARGHPGRRSCRAPGGTGHDPPARTRLDPPADARGGQGLRQRRFRRRSAASLRDPACRPEVPPFRHRRPHHPPRRATPSRQKRRKKIEEPFGWAKTVGGMAQTMLRGVERVGAQFTLTMAACNLARLPKLLAA